MLRRSHSGLKESIVNTNSLTASLLSQLQGPGVQQVSQQLGLDQNQASKAVTAALPLLMGALGSNASQPQGAQSLLNALQRDHLGGAGGGGGFDLGGILGAVLGGGGGGAATNGAGILGHVFGGQSDQAAQVLGNKTGLDSGKAGQLLAVLAPIVMSFLAQRFAQQGNASELGQALSAEAPPAAAGGIGSLLNAFDQDGDGQFGISDVMGLLGKR
jgi:hypothetical protein